MRVSGSNGFTTVLATPAATTTSSQVAVFNGTTSQVDLGTIFRPTPTDKFVISMWAKMADTPADGTLFGNQEVSSPWKGLFFMWRPLSGDFALQWGTNAGATRTYIATSAQVALSSSEFNHIVLIYDGANGISLYTNGNLVTPTVNSGTVNSFTYVRNTLIGSGSDAQAFTGKIANVALGLGMSTTWDATDVAQLYALGRSGNLLSHAKSGDINHWYRLSGTTDDAKDSAPGTPTDITYE